ncbi:DUF4179 domain-containing protein [Paenibacillus sp. VCA1]|uniref:DUF4179 domain-containing protein n=1 Tax=Paenibacillus sp. VCA1 TaxID=3039148 RepID=UPI002872687B|nr:DUF4179 domain-containing protein [Paenibacillus sp. VCA1]MDR9857156.1 DUF4179 domain-containing protein [Paenibacillus sp. VCA1]
MTNHEDWMIEMGGQEVRQAVGMASDNKLDEALRKGIRRAAAEQTGPMYRFRTAKRVRVAAAVLAVLLVGGAGAAAGYKLYPVPAAGESQTNVQIPAYVEKMFDKSDNFLVMLKQAAEHGLYHKLNQSVSAGGYTINIEGTVSDSRRIILFYTTENGNESLPLRLSYNHPPQLLDEQGRPLEGSFTWDTYAKLPKDQPLTKGIMIFDFKESGQMPEKLQIQTTWSQLKPEGSNVSVKTENLTIPVTLQHGPHARDIEERPIHVDITQSGQQITFTKMIQSPLRTDLEFDFKSSNGKKLEKIEATLDLVSQEKQAKQRLNYDAVLRFDRTLVTPEGGAIYLTSSFYSEHRELWLKFYYASFEPDHEVEIAIDPKQGALVQTPDSQISLKQEPEKSSDQKLALRLMYGSQQPVQGGYFELKDTFTDADGQPHPFVQEYQSAEGTYLYIPNYQKYPGPFKFEIVKYWGNVLEMHEEKEQRIR